MTSRFGFARFETFWTASTRTPRVEGSGKGHPNDILDDLQRGTTLRNLLNHVLEQPEVLSSTVTSSQSSQESTPEPRVTTMLNFSTLLLRSYYAEVGFNEDNLYSNLTRSSSGA
jgi:hypothetical protein